MWSSHHVGDLGSKRRRQGQEPAPLFPVSAEGQYGFAARDLSVGLSDGFGRAVNEENWFQVPLQCVKREYSSSLLIRQQLPG